MRRADALAARLRALPVVPVLAVLVALQLAQAFWFAFNTPHNGWIWYSGGDATEYWTETWSIAHGIIPQAIIGYGLPVFYAWIPLVTGTTLIDGAVVIVFLQALVLVPLALILFWLVADRLYGRVFAWTCAALWVAGPLLLLHGFIPRYHPVFEELFLVPHMFGFTNMADLPSLVAVLACVWQTLRWYDTGSANSAVLGGLFAGLAIGLKPSNGFIFPALLILLIASRRPRQVAVWFAALVPALIALTVWKMRGLGNLPLTTSSYEHLRLAAGATAAPVAVTTSKYVQFDWHHLQQELRDLREVFWSLRFLEFLLVAGSFGLIRKSPLRGSFVVVWFLAYGIFKGSSPKADFASANWFRLAEPGLPAYVMIAVGVAFCLPALGRRVRRTSAALADTVRLDVRALAVPVVALALVPLAVLLIASPASSMHMARDNHHVNEAPLTDAFHLHARSGKGKVVLSWTKPPTGKTVPVYVLYRSALDNGCHRPQQGSNECFIKMSTLAVVRGTRFVDRHSGKHAHWYRVGALAAYKKSVLGGDLMLFSREAVRARAR